MRNYFILLFIVYSNFSKVAIYDFSFLVLILLRRLLDDDYGSVVSDTLSVKVNRAPKSNMEILDIPTAISQKC